MYFYDRSTEKKLDCFIEHVSKIKSDEAREITESIKELVYGYVSSMLYEVLEPANPVIDENSPYFVLNLEIGEYFEDDPHPKKTYEVFNMEEVLKHFSADERTDIEDLKLLSEKFKFSAQMIDEKLASLKEKI